MPAEPASEKRGSAARRRATPSPERRPGACVLAAGDGDPGRIRTCDPVLRRHVLYPAELPGRIQRRADCSELAVPLGDDRRSIAQHAAVDRVVGRTGLEPVTSAV